MKKEYKKPVTKVKKLETSGLIMCSGYEHACD